MKSISHNVIASYFRGLLTPNTRGKNLPAYVQLEYWPGWEREAVEAEADGMELVVLRVPTMMLGHDTFCYSGLMTEINQLITKKIIDYAAEKNRTAEGSASAEPQFFPG
jgi:hypothetical protein